MFKGLKTYLAGFPAANAMTKFSYFVMGFSCFLKKQFMRGLILLFIQVAFIFFMITVGVDCIKDIITLSVKMSGFDSVTGLYVDGDNGVFMMLYGVFTFVVIAFFALAYFKSVLYALQLQNIKKPKTFRQDLSSLINSRFHISMLFLPITALMLFTIVPLIFMILIAFTNYSYRLNNTGTPSNFFTWSGIESFKALFKSQSVLAGTFGGVFAWTMTWAFFATFLNYFLGIGVAMLINTKGLRFKPLIRMCFVVSIAVPQFITLLVMRNFLSNYGVLNNLLREWGLITQYIKFLDDPLYAKITVIVVNLWVGIPFTMLITSGILMNIPAELYEAASIDGAGKARIFISITLPYVLFITSPYLITQFIGNINNFNVIFLLTGGMPSTSDYYIAGRTDLLISWLYKLTSDSQDYSIASVIGIAVFVISAVFSLIMYRHTAAYKKEGDFA